jgi:hypothetical protein
LKIAHTTPRIERSYFAISYVVIVLLALSFIAFAPAYFLVLDSRLPWFMHVHAAFMFLWMAILVAQPILIKQGKHLVHRLVGKASYVIVPFLLLSAYAMIRHSYVVDFEDIPRELGREMHRTEIIHQARVFVALPFYYFIALIVFYSCRIVFRKRPLIHAKFMIATALTVTGPIVDRCVYYALNYLDTDLSFPLEYIAFLIIDVIVLTLLYVDYKKGHSIKVSLVILAFYVGGQLLYRFGLSTLTWQTVAGWMLTGTE